MIGADIFVLPSHSLIQDIHALAQLVCIGVQLPPTNYKLIMAIITGLTPMFWSLTLR